VIISDNASHFKCSNSVLKSVWKTVITDTDVLNYVANTGITWKFITELAPWMGGFYERLVGLVKQSFDFQNASNRYCPLFRILSNLEVEPSTGS
jgi:hypothetical protein